MQHTTVLALCDNSEYFTNAKIQSRSTRWWTPLMHRITQAIHIPHHDACEPSLDRIFSEEVNSFWRLENAAQKENMKSCKVERHPSRPKVSRATH